MKKLLIFSIISMSITFLKSQNWTVVPNFEEGEKTGIATIKDTLLFVSLNNGVMRSFDGAITWTKTLQTSETFTVFATQKGVVLAGGRGKVFYSTNFGRTWDSSRFTHNFPMTQFVADSEGGLFGISTDTIFSGYTGAGVFHSVDNGRTWQARNSGFIHNSVSVNHIAIDKNNRLYITHQNDLNPTQSGLYISDNKGITWQHIPIKINGQNVIEDGIRPNYSWGLSIGKDSIFYSFDGVAGRVAVWLNLAKKLSQVTDTNVWKPLLFINPTNQWWQDRVLNNVHFAKKGDAYSSIYGRISIGGGAFKAFTTANWGRNTNIRADLNGFFHPQHFAETASGKVYMVQDFDEFIYETNASLLTKTIDLKAEVKMSIYPNPSFDGHFALDFDAYTEGSVLIINTLGQTVFQEKLSGKSLIINLERIQSGVYWVWVKTNYGEKMEKIIIQKS